MLSGIVTTQKKLAEMQQVIEQALEATEQFDRDNGLLVGEKSSLQQEMLALQQQASHDVVAEAIHNLKPLALETLVVEASSADATHPES